MEIEDNLKAELFAMVPDEAFKQTKTQFSYARARTFFHKHFIN